MVKLTNSHIIVNVTRIMTDHFHLRPNLEYVLDTLQWINPDTKGRTPQYTTRMTEDGESYVKIPLGYSNYIDLSFLYDLITEDSRTNEIPSLDLYNSEDYHEVESTLSSGGITLRSDQVYAITQMLKSKSGIVQMSTGSGKTFVMAGYLSVLMNRLDRVPNVIILEPTTNLVKQTVKELNSVGVPASIYNKSRNAEGIVVTHPSSLNNDIKKNPDHVKDVEILLCDEGHHLSADSWNYLLDTAVNLECRLAVSASIVSHDIITNSLYDLSTYSLEELMLIGILGGVLVNLPPKYFIDRGILATPVLMRVKTDADESPEAMEKLHIKQGLSKRRRRSRPMNLDYALIRKHVIGSKARVDIATDAVIQFTKHGRRVLLLVSTIDEAKLVLSSLYEKGLGDYSILMSGGGFVGKIEYVHDTESYELVDHDESVSHDNHDLVIVGTSVMYEGVDLDMLDAVVLFNVGKEPRVLIQTVGRVLRRSKTGKYAYIVDFTDSDNNILSRHSNSRYDMLMNIIGVSSTLTFNSISISQLSGAFKRLESL